MQIDGYTRTCGLIGNPVEHTMSPAIHNTLAEEFHENLVYVPFRVPEGRVGDAVRGAYALNMLGLNVTVPYKSQVIPYLEELDPLARLIGAVNTLVRTETGFKGYNTDMPGLYRAMCEDGVWIDGAKVLILGAGGVARAVAILAARKEAEEIVIANRTLGKAEKIAKEVNDIVGRPLAKAISLEACGGLPGKDYIAIQATNVGMFPKIEEAPIEDTCFYQKVRVGYDLIFNPAETKFMRLVTQNGGRAFGGLKMLLYQGIIAYELWTGTSVTQDMTQKAYAEMKKAMYRTDLR